MIFFTTKTEKFKPFSSQKNAYSQRLKEILNILYPSVQINIINSGISGDRATGELKRVDRDVLSYNPDLVVISYGLNDVTFDKKGLETYIESLKALFKKVKESGAECIFMSQNYYNNTISCHLPKGVEELAQNLMKSQKEGLLKDYYQNDIKLALDMGAFYVAPSMGCDIADAYLNAELGSGYEWWKNFYEFHKLAIKELQAFDYEKFKANGFKVEHLGDYPLKLETKPE